MTDMKKSLLLKYHNICNFLEKETVGTYLTIYGTSTLMLLVAYMKRKPAYLVRQFKKPGHVPEDIINERIMHTGLINEIKQSGQDTILLVKHRPLIPIFTSNKHLLPVKLPGVNVNSNGYSWLQSCLVGQQATFIPLHKPIGKDYLISQLCLVHPPKGNKLVDISETLLKLQFARFTQDAGTEARRNAKYYKYLQQIEASVIKKEKWLNWIAHKPLLWKYFNNLRVKLLPKAQLLPELVR